jgi:hypothetical protein
VNLLCALILDQLHNVTRINASAFSHTMEPPVFGWRAFFIQVLARLDAAIMMRL